MNNKPSPFDTGEIDLDDSYVPLSQEEIDAMWEEAMRQEPDLFLDVEKDRKENI